MKTYVAKIVVEEAWETSGTTAKGKTWKRQNINGKVTEGDILVGEPVVYSRFMNSSEQSTPYRQGEVLSVDLDSVKFDRRRIILEGLLLP